MAVLQLPHPVPTIVRMNTADQQRAERIAQAIYNAACPVIRIHSIGDGLSHLDRKIGAKEPGRWEERDA